MAMTGHTQDIDAAFDQWEQERVALSDIFNQNQELEKLVKRMQVNWEIIRGRLWGKYQITAETTVPDLTTRAQKDIIEAAIKLDIWHDDALLSAENQEAVDQYKQLVMKLEAKP
jgi:hypothetical protein